MKKDAVNDGCSDVVNTDSAARCYVFSNNVMKKDVVNDGCSDVVTTRTHVNYKLLVLYRIC